MRSTLTKIIRRFGITVLSLYLGASALLYFLQDEILFAPSPVDASIAEQFEELAIEFSREGITVRGWYIPASAPEAATIIYYGGNGDELSRTLSNITAIGDFNYLMVNYRSYGDSEGAPGEEELKTDAVAIIAELLAQERIDLARTHIIGRSLGTGIATHVAANYETASLTLITPYDSIRAVAQGRYPIFPIGLLLRHSFDSTDYVDSIVEPTLIIKAEQDRIVPHAHTDALTAAWRSPMQSVTLPGTGHNTIYTTDFYREVRSFIASR